MIQSTARQNNAGQECTLVARQRKYKMLLTASSRLELVRLCPCAGPGSAGSGIVEFRWREALSTEPGGPPNRRQP